MRLKAALEALGVPFLVDSPTNQQFPILPDSLLDGLRERYGFATIQRVDDQHTAVRFCTSWATDPRHVDALIGDVRRAMGN